MERLWEECNSPIKGVIIDELWAIDWILRSVRCKAREVEKAYVALENRPHRSPTDAEVAQQLGITTDELHQIFNQISFVSVVALDEPLSVGSERGDRLSLVDTLEDKGPRTRWRVCQMHTKAVLQLRARMQDAR